MTTNEMKTKAQAAWDRYHAQRLPPGVEPKWIHPSYRALRAWLDGDDTHKEYVRGLLHSLDLADGLLVDAIPGFPAAGKRLVEGGAKVGTTTWIFDRRNECQPERYMGWVILYRDVSPAIREVACRHGFRDFERVWMAYHPDRPMGDTAMTGEEIGPCLSRAEVVSQIEEVQAMTSWL